MDIDLFAGARGWEAAARDLGINPLGIEVDETICQTSEAAGLPYLCKDVAELEPLDFRPARRLIGSPVCTTFTVAGKGEGRRALEVLLRSVKAIGAGEWPAELLSSTGDPLTALVVQPLRWALALRPEVIAWEQVREVLPIWEACAEVLRANGYHVVTGLLHAEQHGVPSTRVRAFLGASRTHAVRLPTPTHSRYYPQDPSRLDPGVLPWVSMGEALCTSEPFTVVSNYGTGGDPKRRGMRTSEQPAATVTSKIDRFRIVDADGNSRKVSVAEAAAFQTFPAGWPFAGGPSEQYLQIGNAVPPKLARAMLEAIL